MLPQVGSVTFRLYFLRGLKPAVTTTMILILLVDKTLQPHLLQLTFLIDAAF